MRISDWSSDVCSSDLLFAKVDRRFDDVRGAEDGFALAEDTNGAGSCKLGPGRRRRPCEFCKAGINQWIVGPLQVIDETIARFPDSGADGENSPLDRRRSLLRLRESHRIDLIAIIAIVPRFSPPPFGELRSVAGVQLDRKSTRLNSSH